MIENVVVLMSPPHHNKSSFPCATSGDNMIKYNLGLNALYHGHSVRVTLAIAVLLSIRRSFAIALSLSHTLLLLLLLTQTPLYEL